MTELQSKIINLVKEGYTYRQIQLKLGMPPKKMIKETIKEFLPELYEIIHDTQKLKLWRKQQELNS